MSRGVLVETLETATTWSGADRSCTATSASALRGALAQRGTPAVVMCHVSHLYPTGASLYFTFLARRQPGARARAVAGRQAGRRADAISAAGATITHHHAVGTDHAPWLEAEVGALGHRGAAGGQGARRPGGHHEPRQAPAAPAARR